jgi:SAC3/GANP family
MRPLASSRTKLVEPETKSFATGFAQSTRPSAPAPAPLVGTNQSLEKPYLRLTTFPRAELVRPLPVLRQALAHIQKRYVQTEDFEWCNEQLKSLRQDLTVQAIRSTPFVLEVYETHARILLEHGDLDEFNQCQCNIQQFTSPGSLLATAAEMDTDSTLSFAPALTGSAVPLQQSAQSAKEFRAYAILYGLVRNAGTDLKLQLQRRKASLITPLSSSKTSPRHESSKEKMRHRKRKHRSESAPAHETSSSGVEADSERHRGNSALNVDDDCEDHALAVVLAVQHGNPVLFFRLYESAPHLSAYLMDFLVQRVRVAAYAAMMASYRPDVTVALIQQRLHFADGEEVKRFLRSQRAVWSSSTDAETTIDCQQSSMALLQK